MVASERWKRLRGEWILLSYSITLVLGVTYWLMRERDDRRPRA